MDNEARILELLSEYILKLDQYTKRFDEQQVEHNAMMKQVLYTQSEIRNLREDFLRNQNQIEENQKNIHLQNKRLENLMFELVKTNTKLGDHEDRLGRIEKRN